MILFVALISNLIQVSDLPFGKKMGSALDNLLLYPALLNEWARVCAPPSDRYRGSLNKRYLEYDSFPITVLPPNTAPPLNTLSPEYVFSWLYIIYNGHHIDRLEILGIELLAKFSWCP